MAISIDAWWKEIGDRQTEQALLHALSGEFKANRELLTRQIEVNRSRTSAASTLLDVKANSSQLEAELLNSHWKWVIRGGTYFPSSGVLQSAVSSGNISVLTDPELQVLLANWPGRVNVMVDVQNRVTNLIFDQMVPWMRTQTALPDYSFGETGIPSASSKIEFDLLISSTVIENFLREVVAWGRVINGVAEGLDNDIASIQLRLQKNLVREQSKNRTQ